MIETAFCDDKEQLVAYIYDELDAVVRRRVEDHLRICPGCAEEITALSGVRRELAEWRPPEAALGFTIVQAPRTAAPPASQPLRRAWWPSTVPAWAQAAAAVLVVATGLAVANLQVRYGADGLVITTGWMAPAPGVPATAATTGDDAERQGEWRAALTALETSLRSELGELRRTGAAQPVSASRQDELSYQRVADLIAQSERRQNQQLALRIAQFGRDIEVQRRSDLVRINQGFGQFEGRAGAEIARQRQMLDYIMRVSAQPPPQ